MDKEINKDNSGEHLSVKQATKGKDNWIPDNYVNDCEVGVNLNVIKELIEANKIFLNRDGTVLLAYKIRCIDGMKPVTLKYFA